ncbi:hypothetical protein VP1G_02686 [Cytospora mali]|uniref:Uncharacterized protein n=1 Tax=Cytospora mali TaxID=578113 RepID=A0A194UU58_CYTMA|nr:hypothetical protein VP1G_02686 [Valsa mali var. pyri (nom. inval.)]
MNNWDSMENSKSLSSLADHLSEMPGHHSLPRIENPRVMKKRLAIEKVIKDNPDDEAAQIEAIAKIRPYFMGHGRAVDIVNSYTNGTVDVQETVCRIAEPIERAYITANGGRLFVAEERIARTQRGYHSPEKALEMWGPEEDLDELQSRVTGPDDGPRVEGELWDLYYTILHAAKKTPWRDESAQQKLVDLVAALKARPDPDFPANMTIPLKNNWIYEWGRLWSDAILFGPSSREAWNDSLGCGAGWYPPEVRGSVNINAFWGRLTGQGVHDFGIYATWALREALDEEIDVSMDSHEPAPSREYKAEALFEVAAVWIRLAGQSVFEYLLRDAASNKEKASRAPKESKWDQWQKRFEEEAARLHYSPMVTAVAKECAEIMSLISAQAKNL